jgi:formamidopyrimidine-DNA glycosylase
MTGVWRFEQNGSWENLKHDHLVMELSDGSRLVYHDPRRFGFVEVLNSKNIGRRFKSLGVEPFASKIDLVSTLLKLKKLRSPIKPALMNQNYIVGVGNIYASEILYLSKVSPFRACNKISDVQFYEIFKNTKKVLSKAISKGGSTIESYRSSFGNEGEFQNEFLVYGKAGEECPICNRKILHEKQVGRSTYWCKECQY